MEKLPAEKKLDWAGCKAALLDVKELLILWIEKVRAESLVSPAVLSRELLSWLKSKA